MNTKDGVVWPGTVARVVQCLPGKHDALSSNTSTIKKVVKAISKKMKEEIEKG
jgi:hypothetical protein